MRRTAALVIAALALTSCSTGSRLAPASSPTPSVSAPAPVTTAVTTTPSPKATSHLPRPQHVVVVVLENKPARSVLGSPHAPYLTSLARTGATFTRSYAVEHPSEPNYLDLFSGGNQGVTDDSCPHAFRTPDLGSELLAAGLGFVGWSEGLPQVGSTVCSAGRYARKHNPWVDFRDVPPSANQPFSAFPTDYDLLPTVSWVVPDLCHDMHDCSVSTGDRWVRDHLGGYATWAMTHDSLLVVTFDEDDRSSSNRIATFFVGQQVRPGSYSERIDHVDVLRTLETMYGLPHAGPRRGSAILDCWAST